MIWVGKAVGGVLGLMIAGNLWISALGVLVGHQFDRGLARRARETPAGGQSPERIRAAFFRATFAVMGHIAKADGRVSETEIRAARLIMHVLKLSPEQVSSAVRYFMEGKRPGYPLDATLERLRQALQGRPDLARSFVEIQFQAAVEAGPVDATKRDLLWRVARSLGLGRVELVQIEAMVRARQPHGNGKNFVSLEDAYGVLGIEPGVSDREVKTAYRRLMNQHHPDKLVARGLPESMLAAAERRTQEIRAAYERIRDQRGFK